MKSTEIEVGGRKIYVQITEPTLRQTAEIYGKYMRPKMTMDGKNSKVHDLEIDIFGMALDMMTMTVKLVKIDDKEVKIEKVEDWDKIDEIDRRVSTALMGLMVDRFRQEAGSLGLG